MPSTRMAIRGTSPPVATAAMSVGRTFHVTNELSNVTDSTQYKNHGDYVKQAGDRADAAHSCIGMPIVSGK